MAGTDGEMILTKSESGWVRRATIRTTDMNVLTAEIVLNEEGSIQFGTMQKTPERPS